jgi:hypothetical protein
LANITKIVTDTAAQRTNINEQSLPCSDGGGPGPSSARHAREFYHHLAGPGNHNLDSWRLAASEEAKWHRLGSLLTL